MSEKHPSTQVTVDPILSNRLIILSFMHVFAGSLQLIIIFNSAPGHTPKPAINYHKLSLGLYASGSCIASKVVR